MNNQPRASTVLDSILYQLRESARKLSENNPLGWRVSEVEAFSTAYLVLVQNVHSFNLPLPSGGVRSRDSILEAIRQTMEKLTDNEVGAQFLLLDDSNVETMQAFLSIISPLMNIDPAYQSVIKQIHQSLLKAQKRRELSHDVGAYISSIDKICDWLDYATVNRQRLPKDVESEIRSLDSTFEEDGIYHSISKYKHLLVNEVYFDYDSEIEDRRNYLMLSWIMYLRIVCDQ